MVEGPPNWTNFLDFWRMFSREGATVVASTYTRVGGLYDTGFRHDASRPIESLADYCLGCYTNLGLPSRTNLLEKYITDYKADGFLINSVKSCNSFSAGQLLILRELEKRTGVPGGFIESDLVDPRYFGKANIENRLQSYMQMLDARKGRATRMKVVVGIDLGSTTTKAVLFDESGEIVGRGITNSRSNYEVACAVARDEGLVNVRFTVLERALGKRAELAGDAQKRRDELLAAFRLELYLDQLGELYEELGRVLRMLTYIGDRDALAPAVDEVIDAHEEGSARVVRGRRSQERLLPRPGRGRLHDPRRARGRRERGLSYERVTGLFDRAILEVETRREPRDFGDMLRRAAKRVVGSDWNDAARVALLDAVNDAADTRIEEVSFVGTGYGRQTLPFPKAAVKSEILCHGRGAHRVFPGTRTVLDIGGQDTKAIQVDDKGVVTSFQMNDRCAAGCGRYLGYIADELNLGLHELGPLALGAQRVVKVNSTCTVFAGAELRERLGLGERREDILAGLHRSIMLRAMSLLARSGGVFEEFTFTGGVCKNPMATKVLRELVNENYGEHLTLNAHPDSIYMGALGAAMFALDDVNAGRPAVLPTFVEAAVQGALS